MLEQALNPHSTNYLPHFVDVLGLQVWVTMPGLLEYWDCAQGFMHTS